MVFYKVKGQKNVFQDKDGNLFINDGKGNMIPHEEYLKTIYKHDDEMSGLYDIITLYNREKVMELGDDDEIGDINNSDGK
jgi:hypothetical protein